MAYFYLHMKTGITTTIQIRLLQSLWLALCMPFLILASCGDGRHHGRLEEISQSLDAPPSGVTSRQDSIIRSALAELREMPADSLPESDRHFRDLLLIKASDKAYMEHTSDSLILDVIGYYSRHPENPLYPEALYYGGRVYSDLGDYPTALRYLQDALDILPSAPGALRLRDVSLGQTAWILNRLGLYDQAIPYLKENIQISEARRDTFGSAYNNRLLGAVYLHQEKYDSADKHFREAHALSKCLPPRHAKNIEVYLAAVRYYTGSIREALRLIRPLPAAIDSPSKNIALAYAANIYMRAGILDTAYMYARELAFSTQPSNRKTGYKILLDPALRHMMPADSLELLLSNYKNILEEHFSKNETNGVMLQNSLYNYSAHERQREKAEEKSARLTKTGIFLLIVVLTLSSIILYLKNLNKRNLIRLHETLNNLTTLREMLDKDATTAKSEMPERDEAAPPNDRQSLIGEIKRRLSDLEKEASANAALPASILESGAYTDVRAYLDAGKPIPPQSDLWGRLEATVTSAFPEFKRRLQLLAGVMRQEELHMAMLIKCGMSVTMLSILLGRAKSTITYRREALSKRILGENAEPRAIDSIIRLL